MNAQSQLTIADEPAVRESEWKCDYSCLLESTPCPDYKICIVRKKLLQHVSSRYNSAKNDAIQRFHINPPEKADIQSLFYDSLQNGLTCRYCENKLNIFATRGDIRFAISLDHIIALSCGGTNSRRNLELICHRCNIIKSVSHPDHFDTVVLALKTKYGVAGLNDYLNKIYPLLFANFVMNRDSNEVR